MKRYSLLDLHKSVKSLVAGINADFWIVAEVSQASQKQHAYLELVQKDEKGIVAKARANIWAFRLSAIKEKIGEQTLSQLLSPGAKILMNVTCTFHEVYGFSLTINDLDPSYTLGELEKKRQETLLKLEKEGLFDRQKQLHYPSVVQKIAIVSSPTAAGYSDFINQLENNPYGYHFDIQLFATAVQGERAETEIIQQLAMAQASSAHAIALIRGGGSKLDLQVFDEYAVCEAIATSRLPILTGIGHERDMPIADLVAHTRLKTPTAAAEFLVGKMLEFETELLSEHDRISDAALQLARAQTQRLNDTYRAIHRRTHEILKEATLKLDRTLTLTQQATKYLIKQRTDALTHLSQQIQLLSPEQILARGYTITTIDGKPISSHTPPSPGEVLLTRGHQFTTYSQIIPKPTKDEK